MVEELARGWLEADGPYGGINMALILSLETVRFSMVTQSCPTLCDPMNCGMPGLPVHQQLPEITQTHVHRVSDATQPSTTKAFLWDPGILANIMTSGGNVCQKEEKRAR